MLHPPFVKLKVFVIGNPSLNVREDSLIVSNQWFPSIYKFLTNITVLCNEQPHRIYWRLTELDYLPVHDYLSLKSALNQMHEREIYIVRDDAHRPQSQTSDGKRAENLSEDSNRLKFNSYDAESLTWVEDEFSTGYPLTDLEILRCAAPSYLPNTKVQFSHLFAKSPPLFTREREDILRQLMILMKEFLKNLIWPSHLSSETQLDPQEFLAVDSLSLLCVRTFSGSSAMLEAPPGSREDLVEAARTPCTPTDLDTMLYGYTNSIYVLDHTPESLPDIDMLQLFASPAGRALVTSDNQPRGSTSTSSLSRESSSRLKSVRRTSGTGTVSAPTSPPKQRKSSAELYKEAVEILGLTCSLTDSCRCIDCQSNYFDCDDDCGDARTELAAGTPVLLDHALSHPLTCSIQ